MLRREFDPARRAFLRGRPLPARRPAVLPWLDAGVDFHETCTRCRACLEACPEDIIVADAEGFPGIDFRRGACSFCGACAAACPEPLFDRAAAEAWDLKAAIGPDCLARRQVVCQSCKEVCGEGAIHFSLAPGRVPLPGLDAARCTGCGACVAVCPAGAITVAPPNGAEVNGAEVNGHG